MRYLRSSTSTLPVSSTGSVGLRPSVEKLRGERTARTPTLPEWESVDPGTPPVGESNRGNKTKLPGRNGQEAFLVAGAGLEPTTFGL